MKNKRAVQTSLGEIILQSNSFTDQMIQYVRVNPLASLVIWSKKFGWSRQEQIERLNKKN